VGEIDYYYRSKCEGHPLWMKCQYVFIECKNWKETISSEKMSHFVSLVESKSVFHNCCGVYLTTSSFSPQAINASKKGVVKGLIILRLSKKNLQAMIDKGFKHYLEDDFDTLLSKL
jgi:restriction endonuclease Mrr